MLDEETPQTPEAEPTVTEDSETDWKAEADKWKAMSRKHEGTAKQNAEAAKRLSEIEEAQKTAEQKAADKAAITERERDSAKIEALRLSVALDKGLTKVQAKRLIGATEEELAADADELLASFTRQEVVETPAPSAKPKEVLKSGSTNAKGDEIVQLTRDDLKSMTPEEITKAKAEGRFNTILGIK